MKASKSSKTLSHLDTTSAKRKSASVLEVATCGVCGAMVAMLAGDGDRCGPVARCGSSAAAAAASIVACITVDTRMEVVADTSCALRGSVCPNSTLLGPFRWQTAP